MLMQKREKKEVIFQTDGENWKWKTFDLKKTTTASIERTQRPNASTKLK